LEYIAKEESSMNKCIYSLKNDSESTFKKQEHIFSACIGGSYKLPNGYVCDEVNEMFSPLELRFVRSSNIAIYRMFYGPGKRGSHSDKKATESEVHVMIDNNTKKAELGFIKKGKQYIINQLHFYSGEKACQIFLAVYSEKSTEENVQTFFEQIENYNNSPIVIKSSNLSLNEFILGVHNNRWFIVINESCSYDESCDLYSTALSGFLRINKEGLLGQIDKIKYHSGNTETNLKLNFDLSDNYRVAAKTAFNCLAYLKGADFVLSKQFDSIRKAIYSGENIAKYVSLANTESHSSSLFEMFDKASLGKHLHLVIINKSQSSLVATVCFYNLNITFCVTLAEEFTDQIASPIGLICDWENKREITLMEFTEKFG